MINGPHLLCSLSIEALRGCPHGFVCDRDILNDTLPQSEWGYIAEYNRVIGGVRLFQDRGSSVPCKSEVMDKFNGTSSCIASI